MLRAALPTMVFVCFCLLTSGFFHIPFSLFNGTIHPPSEVCMSWTQGRQESSGDVSEWMWVRLHKELAMRCGDKSPMVGKRKLGGKLSADNILTIIQQKAQLYLKLFGNHLILCLYVRKLLEVVCTGEQT